MEQVKQNQVDTLFKCAEEVNNVFGIVYKIAVLAKYPAFAEIVTAAEELNKNIFLIQNFIINPDADSYVDSVQAQHEKMTRKNLELMTSFSKYYPTDETK